MSALASRYSTITLLPYFFALGSQLLASLYSAISIPETVQDKDDDKSEASGDEGSDDEDDHDDEGGLREAVEQTMETVVAPVKPLGLLAPYRSKETGRIEWRLFLVTVSLLSTTIGVSLRVHAGQRAGQQGPRGWAEGDGGQGGGGLSRHGVSLTPRPSSSLPLHCYTSPTNSTSSRKR